MFEAEDHDGARDGRLFALTMEDFTLPSQRNGRPDLRRNSRSWTASSPKLWRRRLQPSTTTTTHSPPPPESRWRPRKPGKFGCAWRRKKSFTQRICGSGIVQFSGCSNVTLNDFWATTARPSQSCSELGPGGSVIVLDGRRGDSAAVSFGAQSVGLTGQKKKHARINEQEGALRDGASPLRPPLLSPPAS
jgi:hypothetical protein